MFNPLVTNGLSHPYHSDESISILGTAEVFVTFLFHVSMKIMSANRIAPDGTPRFAASHLMAILFAYVHKKDARIIWVNVLKPFVRVYRSPALAYSLIVPIRSIHMVFFHHT